MAISVLTDSEKKAFYEVCGTTQTKVEAVLRRLKLDRVPDEVEALRKLADKQRGKNRGLWQAIWTGLGVVKSNGDKLFKD